MAKITGTFEIPDNGTYTITTTVTGWAYGLKEGAAKVTAAIEGLRAATNAKPKKAK